MKKSKPKQKQRRKDSTKRGLMTISPPAKVSPSSLAGVRVLTSGVDSLNLALDVKWKDPFLFEILEAAKNIALKRFEPVPLTIQIPSRDEVLLFNLAPHGTKGYKWLFSNNEFAFRMYDALKPQSRPNVMVEIRSETLWRRGIREALDIISEALKALGANILRVKTSRIDLCLDMLIPVHLWSESLFDNMVARARNVAKYTKNDALTGVQIGKGKLTGRLYDKALEIETSSHKTWMYNVWGIKQIEECERAIRIEFQLLRETIKELGFDTIDETIQNLDAIWAYCSQDWLKFQTNPGKHHTQRKTLLWWSQVQNSFLGVQEANSAIRSKAVRTTQLQLASQIVGLTTSLAATKDEFGDEPLFAQISYESLGLVFQKALRLSGKTEKELREAINDKRARNHRGKQKYQSANWKRLNRGLPTDMQALTLSLENPDWLELEDAS
jgi:hypothetical protein